MLSTDAFALADRVDQLRKTETSPYLRPAHETALRLAHILANHENSSMRQPVLPGEAPPAPPTGQVQVYVDVHDMGASMFTHGRNYQGIVREVGTDALVKTHVSGSRTFLQHDLFDSPAAKQFWKTRAPHGYLVAAWVEHPGV